MVQLSATAVKDPPSGDTPHQHQKHEPSTKRARQRGARGPRQEGTGTSSGGSSSNEMGTPDRGVTTAVEDRDFQREVSKQEAYNSVETEIESACCPLTLSHIFPVDGRTLISRPLISQSQIQELFLMCVIRLRSPVSL